MLPNERPNLRYPLLWRGGRGRVLFALATVVIVALLAIHVGNTRHERLAMALSAGSFAAIMIALSVRSLYEFARFRHAFLVADAEGVAIVRGDQRQGLPWDAIQSFELQEGIRRGRLVLKGEIDSLSIPLPTNERFRFSGIEKALNRHLALENDPAGMLIPESEVERRMERFFDAPPPVEMEPNVPYRYADAHGLAWRIRAMRWFYVGIAIFLFASLATFARFTPSPTLVYGFAFIAAPLVILTRFFDDALLLRALNDRFLLRDGTLYLLRDDELLALPPGRVSEYHVSFQRFNRHGKGPFAYRMAPQFLEPDIERNS